MILALILSNFVWMGLYLYRDMKSERQMKELHDRLMARSLQDFYHSSNKEPIQPDGKPQNFLKQDIKNAYALYEDV